MSREIDRCYADIEVGDRVCFTRSFPPETFHDFYRLSKDKSPLHHDDGYARATPYQRPILPFLLTSLPLSAISGMMLPGHRSLCLNFQIRAIYPAYYGQEITYSSRVISKNTLYQTITLRTLVFHDSQVLLEAEQIIHVRNDVPGNLAPPHDHDTPIVRDTHRTALITGTASDIKLAIVLNLARKGIHSVVVFPPGEAVSAGDIVQRCQAFGVKVEFIATDTGKNSEGLHPLLERIKNGNDVTDLVHVASPPIQAQLHDLLNTDYFTIKALFEALLPQILARQEGQVLFVGSSAIQHAPKGWENYCAAITAASHYVTGLNNHFGNYGFSGWVLAPGAVATCSEGPCSPGTPRLQPEQIAESAYDLLIGKHGTKGGYLWLEPGLPERFGRFGFHDSTEETSNQRPSKGMDLPKQMCAPSSTVTENSIDTLFRSFFKRDHSEDVSMARVGESPYWDSLSHIEFMLFLESKLGISFNSGEIERTKRYPDLAQLLKEKT